MQLFVSCASFPYTLVSANALWLYWILKLVLKKNEILNEKKFSILLTLVFSGRKLLGATKLVG